MNYEVMFNNIRMKQAWESVYADERFKSAEPEDFHPDRVAFLLRSQIGDGEPVIEASLYTREEKAKMKTFYASCALVWSEHMCGKRIMSDDERRTVVRVLVTQDTNTGAGRVENGHHAIRDMCNYVKEFYR